MGRASRGPGTGDVGRPPTAGAGGRCVADRLDYLMWDRPMQRRAGRSDLLRLRRLRGYACGPLRLSGQRASLRTESRVARVGPTTPTRAGRLADASVDPTE